MKIILLLFLIGSPSYALVEDESLSHTPCPVKSLSLTNPPEPVEQPEEDKES